VFPLLVFFGSEGRGFLLPGEFFCFIVELFEVCFFTASSTRFFMCCSIVTFVVDVFPTAIAVACVASRISVLLNSAAKREAAFLILFSLLMLAWSLAVIGKIKLMSLSEMTSWKSSSFSFLSISLNGCSGGIKFLIRASLTSGSSIFRYSRKKFSSPGGVTVSLIFRRHVISVLTENWMEFSWVTNGVSILSNTINALVIFRA